MAPPMGNTVEFTSVNDSSKNPTSIKRNTWVDCYAASYKADPNRGAAWTSRYNSWYDTCKEFVDDEAELLNAILASQGFNFVLVPIGPKGLLQCNWKIESCGSRHSSSTSLHQQNPPETQGSTA